MGRDVRDPERESDLKRCCVVGEGESLADWLKTCAAAGPEVSMFKFLGDLGGASNLCESVVGDLGAPHWDIKERTARQGT